MDNATNESLFTATLSSTSTFSVSITVRSAILICIAISASFGNFSVFFTLYRKQYLLTPSNKLVLSLTLSNFIISIFILPFVITSSIKSEWVLGKVWCSFTGFIILSILGSSMLTLSAISFDRYYAIVHPLRYPSIITSYRATAIIILCWIISVCCSAPPLFGAWSKYEFYSPRMSCMPLWGLHRGFALFWLSVCLMLPYFTMLASYSCIFKVARSKTKQIYCTAPNRFSLTKRNSFIDEPDINATEHNTEITIQSLKPTTRHPIPSVMSNADDPSMYTQDSGIAASVFIEESAAEQHDYSFSHPHQVPNEVEQFCAAPGIVFQNCEAIHAQPSNCNNANVSSLSNSSNPILTNTENRLTTTALVHRNGILSSDIDPNYLFAATSSKRSSLSNKQNMVSNKQNASALSSPSADVTSRQKRDSLALLSQANRSGSEVTMLCPPSRDFSRSGISSRSSLFSRFSFRAKPWSYSHARYYGNQRKANCTIVGVLGILLFTMGPFLVVTLYEVFHEHNESTVYSPYVSDWVVSAVTILMYLSCLYYPFIYGLWNRTVRKEMLNLLCKRSNRPATRRTRILSLSTHLKDLGLSPRITAAIMQESAAVAAIVRPMKLDDKQGKKRTASSSSQRPIRSKKKVLSKKRARKNADPAKPPPPTKRGEYTMRLKTKEEEEMLSRLDPNYRNKNNENNSNNSKYRDREKPLTSLLNLDSSEVLTSDVLLPALLHSCAAIGRGVSFRRRRQEVVTSHDQPCCSKMLPQNYDAASSPPTYVKSEKSSSSQGSTEDKYPGSCLESKEAAPSAQGLDKKFRSSNLIHLQAGEPIKVRKWSKPQMVDFFAQTLAYGLLEGVKETK